MSNHDAHYTPQIYTALYVNYICQQNWKKIKTEERFWLCKISVKQNIIFLTKISK